MDFPNENKLVYKSLPFIVLGTQPSIDTCAGMLQVVPEYVRREGLRFLKVNLEICRGGLALHWQGNAHQKAGHP